MERRPVKLRYVLAAMGVCLAFLAIQVASGLLFSLVLVAIFGPADEVRLSEAATQLTPVAMVVAQLVTIAVMVPWYLHARGAARQARCSAGSPAPAAGGQSTLARRMLLGAGMVALGLAVQLALSLLLTLVLPLFPDVMRGYQDVMEDAGQTDVASVISLVLLAPIAEELAFRGVSLAYARRGVGSLLVANVIQAALFGIAHLNLVQSLYAFAIGLMLGIVYLRYGKLWPCMLVHLGANGSSFLIDAIDLLPGSASVLVLVFGGIASLVAVVLCVRDLARGPLALTAGVAESTIHPGEPAASAGVPSAPWPVVSRQVQGRAAASQPTGPAPGGPPRPNGL